MADGCRLNDVINDNRNQFRLKLFCVGSFSKEYNWDKCAMCDVCEEHFLIHFESPTSNVIIQNLTLVTTRNHSTKDDSSVQQLSID